MIADSKKVATMINILAEGAEEVRSAVARMVAVRLKFLQVNPSIIGTPLEGNLQAVNKAIDSLGAEASKVVWTKIISARVPSHRNKALD